MCNEFGDLYRIKKTTSGFGLISEFLQNKEGYPNAQG